MFQKLINPQIICALRRFSADANPEIKNTKYIHPFKEILTKKSVIDYLAQNIIYKDDKIAVFNKPPDVGKSKVTKPNATATLIPRVFMEDLMEDIAKLVPDLEDITIAKFPERYTSGVMIISSQKALPFLEKCKRRAKGGTALCDKYLVITQGRPIMNQGSFKLAIKLAGNENSKKKVPIILDQWSTMDRKNQRISLFRVKHSVLSAGPLCALTELYLSSTSANAIRLYLATKLLSPLLGDNVFASRVKGLLGVPMLIDPWSDVANSFKKLPIDLLTALKLSATDTCIVPPMVHLEEVCLPGYKKHMDLVLRAPLPSTFSWTLQQLDIPFNEQIRNRNM